MMAPDGVVMDSLTTLRAKEVVTIAAERVCAIVFAQFAVPPIDQGHCSREKFKNQPSRPWFSTILCRSCAGRIAACKAWRVETPFSAAPTGAPLGGQETEAPYV